MQVILEARDAAMQKVTLVSPRNKGFATAKAQFTHAASIPQHADLGSVLQFCQTVSTLL
jgi:hypothetical protein